MKHYIKRSILIACAMFSIGVCFPSAVSAAEASSLNAGQEIGSEATANTLSDVTPVNISDCQIKLSKKIFTYNGKEKNPSVTISYNGLALVKDQDYTLSYTNNVKVGTATVTVSGLGSFTGTVSCEYTIFPKAPTSVNSSISGKTVVLSWKKTASADGYVLYRRAKKSKEWEAIQEITNYKTIKYTDESCIYNQTYEYALRSYADTDDGTLWSDYSEITSCKFRAEAPKITQISPASDSSFSLTWNLVSQADGYLVYLKKGNSWKRVKTVAASQTNHCTVTGLTYGDSYEFSIKAYWLNEKTKQKGTLSESYFKTLTYTSEYVDGYKLYYDCDGNLITNVEGIIGPQKKYVLYVNRVTNSVTIYAKDSKTDKYTIPVKAFICSTGNATPKGSYKTMVRYRWRPLFHDVYGQWATRIVGHILFHSVYYAKNEDANTLDVTEFNKLGTAASAGCIRLNAADTKWIYDNCKLQTKVVIYDSKDPRPLGIPEPLILEEGHTWDPTDPEMKYLCKENGCHQE